MSGSSPFHARLVLATLALTLASAASAADLRTSYTVDDKAMKAAISGTPITFGLYSDPLCTTAVDSVGVTIDDVDLIERVKRFKPKGGVKPPNTARLVEVLSGVTTASTLYLKVTGAGITAVGGDCQLQYASSDNSGGGTVPCLSQVGNEVYFNGCNVNIRNAGGATATADGLGNLIVGWNEDTGSPNVRTGSHNLVIGPQHSYSSYGGLVAGYESTVSGPHASVSGGWKNSATEGFASVSGGYSNSATNGYASISGGTYNNANGAGSSVSGGSGNTANGSVSWVGGGVVNTASNDASSVSGGDFNTASGNYSSVSGGDSNIASGDHSSVSGGRSNTASGTESSVSGGNTNLASQEASSVSGGQCNVAGPETPPSCVPFGATDLGIGPGGSSISAGYRNRAAGDLSSVTGGTENAASADYSSVSGGQCNVAGPETPPFCNALGSGVPSWIGSGGSSISAGFRNGASGDLSSVTGGSQNTASGDNSSVSGGNLRSVAGGDDWQAGGLFEDN